MKLAWSLIAVSLIVIASSQTLQHKQVEVEVKGDPIREWVQARLLEQDRKISRLQQENQRQSEEIGLLKQRVRVLEVVIGQGSQNAYYFHPIFSPLV